MSQVCASYEKPPAAAHAADQHDIALPYRPAQRRARPLAHWHWFHWFKWRRFVGPAGLAGLALLGAMLVLARQISFGVGLDFDSAVYVHAVRQLQAGAPLLMFDERPNDVYVEQPPLYPALLAAASIGVFDPVDIAGPLNAALFGVLVLLCGAFLRRRLAARPLWAWLGCAAIALSPPLVAQASTALATLPFALFVAATLICVAQRDPNWRRLALAAVCTALASLTRFSGMGLLAVVSMLLLVSSDLRWIVRVRRTIAYAFTAFVPLGIWLLRSHFLTGTFFGGIEGRGIEPFVWHAALRTMGDHMATWVFLELPIENWLGAGWCALLAFVALFVAGAYPHWAAFRPDVRHPLMLFGGFVLAHLALLVVTGESGAVVEISWRYLTPLYVPCVFFAWLVLGELLGARKLAGAPLVRRIPSPRRLALWVLVTLAVAPWLVYQGVMHKSAIAERNQRGFNYDGPRWRESETLRNLADRDIANGRVCTAMRNGPAVFFHTGIAPLGYSCGFPLIGTECDFLVWLRGTPDRCLLAGHDEPFTMPGWSLTENFADGVLLRFNAASPTTLADVVWAHLVPTGRSVRGASWDLHLNAERRELVFAKASCARQEAAERFFLHIYPRSNDALPTHRREFGFDNMDFDFPQRGLSLPGQVRGEGTKRGRATREGESQGQRRCVAVVELPRYALQSLRVGQFAQQELWSVRIDFDSDDGGSALRWSLSSGGSDGRHQADSANSGSAANNASTFEPNDVRNH